MLSNLPAPLVHALLPTLISLLLPSLNNDVEIASANARALIEDFDPRSGHEFRLAIRITLFSLQAASAIAQAGDPDTPANQAIQLRKGALALIQEADKAERRLEQLQAARTQVQEPAPAQREDLETLVNQIEEFVTVACNNRAPEPKPYKLRKIEQRLAKQREREARLAARVSLQT
jgi:hypothetical protein